MTNDIIIGRDESDKKKLGDKGLVYMGKHYVKMGQTTSLSNRILIDVARPHVILVSGKRGSGKSTTISVLAEEMLKLPKEISQQLSIVMFDTMGIFWTMKYPNKREEDLLNEWNLKPDTFNVTIYAPSGYFKNYKKYGIPVDIPFTIKTSELNAEDWCNVFDLEITSNIGILIERTLSQLQDQTYGIDEIIKEIQKDKKPDENTKNAAENRFQAVKSWGLFDKHGTEINDLIMPGKVSILDLSAYTHISGSTNIKSIAISIISRKLLSDRIKARKIEELKDIEKSSFLFSENEENKKEMPLVWFLLDESHEFLPRDKKTPATDALVQILREGRQPGISLVLATQQPGEIHRDVITQTDVVISHRLTAKRDIEALNAMSQSYLVADIQRYLNELPSLKGSAIILDDNSERIYPVKIRPRISWHGGETPSAVFIKKKELVSLGL
ncbi:ATP-binding protein [Candidatus Woesearchaeota archaeon]|nr:ATP-binding protein [Candidatus Woesearchaeota archaeon]